MNVYYNAQGQVLIEFEGQGLELSRDEAEQLFVDIGQALQDMDISQYVEESTDGEQPD